MKGQAYSVAVVLIAVPLLIFLTFYITATQTIKFGTSEKTLSDQIAHVERNVEADFQRVLGISGRRALLAGVNSIVTTGSYIKDAQAVLAELASNGSLGGDFNLIMYNNTLEHWRNKTFDAVAQYNREINFSGTAAENYDGFSINFTSTVSINLSDRLGIAGISRNVQKHNIVSVIDIEDPVHSLNTLGKLPRIIKKYPHPYLAVQAVKGTVAHGNCTGDVEFDAAKKDPGRILVTKEDPAGISGFMGVVSEQVGSGLPAVPCYILGAPEAVDRVNSTVLFGNFTEIYLDETTNYTWSLPISDAIENGYYVHFEGDSGPDFIERLSGDLNGSQSGIESFVNIPMLTNEGIPLKEGQTTVDYLYFPEKDNIGKKVRGLPEWFRMNETIAGRYNLSQLLE